MADHNQRRTRTPLPRPLEPEDVAKASAVLADESTRDEVWADRFALLGDPNRLRLLIAMHAAPGICVTDLSVATGMSDTAVSQALRLLRAHRWVRSTREGRVMRYVLDDDTIHDLLHLLGAGHGPARRSKR